MENFSLEKLYRSLNKEVQTIFVVPLIRFSHKRSDYLYLFYKDLILDPDLTVQSISIFEHYKLIPCILKQRNSILHYHWLEFQDLRSLAAMPFKLFCIFVFKLFGGNLVWTIHNQYPHDQRFLRLHKFIHRKMAKWADILHVHCERAITLMSPYLQVPETKFRVLPHPEFPGDPMPSSKARMELNTHYECDIPEQIPLALMFGNISYYKQLTEVADLIINSELPCRLLIAGPVKKGNMSLYNRLQELAKSSDRIQLIPHFIPEDRVQWFYSAADFCVFNYREILSSGGYHMAQAYDKPILAPALGCLAAEGNKENVSLFTQKDELKELLKLHISRFS